MKGSFIDQIFVVYLVPPSIEELKRRLSKDNRDKDGLRIREARKELEDFYRGRYADLYNLCITTQSGEENIVAQNIYKFYLESFQ